MCMQQLSLGDYNLHETVHILSLHHKLSVAYICPLDFFASMFIKATKAGLTAIQ